jgi:cell division protein ZapD
MAFAVYEHPLNERIRTLMRLEFLLCQNTRYADVSKSVNILPFFQSLFSTIEVLERSDIRPLLSTLLDQHEKNIVRWSSHPGVHDESLQKTLKEVLHHQSAVSNMAKACQQLKEDNFLVSIRSRFSIAGGAVDFDIPQFHYWRLKPKEERQADVVAWLNKFTTLKESLDFSLDLLRQSSDFETKTAENGFYQDACGDNANLLRIKYDQKIGVFPTVSGSKMRYSINFMEPDDTSVKTSINDNISFQLSTC